jgi:hypothetical protein
MSTNSHKNQEDPEIDLSVVFKKIGGVFQRMNTSIFRGIQFFINNSIVIGILFFLGLALGLYVDTTQKTYDHEIIVAPNFGSTDYLYSKVALIESKIKERDTLYLKSLGIKEPQKLLKISIKPIVDVYRFINSSGSEKNFELLKLMAENGDIKKIVEEQETSKNYTYHVISLSTKSFTNKASTVQPLLDFLNNSDFYTKLKKEYVNNIHIKIRANEIIISQIDNFLNSFASDGDTKSDKLVYYNENTQLNDVIGTKDKLTKELGDLRIELVSVDNIIKVNSSSLNIENTTNINGKLKLILPILFIFFFIVLKAFISFYKKQSQKIKNQ